jgi:hypothetical protein
VVPWGRGAWCWFQDPRAIEVSHPQPASFAGWVDWRGQVTIGEYDPVAGTVDTQVIGQERVDDHGSPSILAEPDGRLTVFWSGHDGPRLNYRTSRQPESIGTWGPVRHIQSRIPGNRGFTYPNPVLLTGEQDKVYLFWRGGDWSADFATRTPSGRWGRARRLISVPGQRPYVKVDSNGTDTIALAFTDGHPRERTTSIYYAAYRHGVLWNAEGRRIARMSRTPVSPRRADRVYNGGATGVSGWVWDVALDRRRRPVIVYATFPSATRHLYWYAHYNGRRWMSHFLTAGGPTISPGTIETEYSAGLALDHSNPSAVYLSRKVGRRFQIQRWRTEDGGAHWRHVTVVRTPGADDVRPLVPRTVGGGHRTAIKLLWLHGHYGSYTHYRTTVEFLR